MITLTFPSESINASLFINAICNSTTVLHRWNTTKVHIRFKVGIWKCCFDTLLRYFLLVFRCMWLVDDGKVKVLQDFSFKECNLNWKRSTKFDKNYRIWSPRFLSNIFLLLYFMFMEKIMFVPNNFRLLQIIIWTTRWSSIRFKNTQCHFG